MTDHTPSILLVDDDEDICENMSDICADRGFRVGIAHEGMAALELVQRQPYDVAVLDLKMPGMDGLTLYREIKQVQAATVAFLVTAHAGGSAAQDAVAIGVRHILPKPVDVPRLLRLVDATLEQPLVLVIDDDADLWDLLHARGYRVCIAHDARQAIERLRHSPRVVLLDLKLPDQNGAEDFRLVRKANPATRVLLITGHRAEMEPTVERLQAEGVESICYKPFDIPGLLRSVDHLAEA